MNADRRPIGPFQARTVFLRDWYMIRLAVCGVDEQTRDEIARRVHRCAITRLVEPLQDSHNSLDAVAFVGNQSPGRDQLFRLVDAGKHLLLATDFILSQDGLDEIFDHGIATRVRIAACNPDHAAPSRRLIHDELGRQNAGTFGLIRIHRWESLAADPPGASGTLPVPLVRDLNLALWLARQVPDVVYSIERSGAPGARSIQVHLGFPGGGMALIDYTNGLPAGDGYQSLSVICSSGALYADDHSNRQLVFQGGPARTALADEGLLPLVNLVQQFVDDLAAGADLSGGVSLWRQTRAVSAAVRRSLESGDAVSPEGA